MACKQLHVPSDGCLSFQVDRSALLLEFCTIYVQVRPSQSKYLTPAMIVASTARLMTAR